MINWREYPVEKPESASPTNGYLVIDLWRGAARFDIAYFDGKNFYVDDENHGSVSIRATHWIDLSDIPLP